MRSTPTLPWRVVVPAALAALAACGGGDDGERRATVAPAPPPPAAGAAAARSPALTLAPAAMAPAAQDPALPAASLDALVASRVQAELDQVEQALRLISGQEPARREALEVIRELRVELDKEHPNRLRVRGLAVGLAQGVQLLEGWKGAGRLLPQLVAMV